jgi:hypothetical protein
MHNNDLPVDPRTGIRALGVVNGRIVWPIAGGEPTLLERLDAQHQALNTEIDGLIAADIPTEREAAIAANEHIRARIEARQVLEERIRVQTEQEARRQADADVQRLNGDDPAGRPPARVSSEPRTYGEGTRSSYFLDLARVQMGQGDGDGGVAAARDRLARHAKELEVELPAREARRDELAHADTDRELRRAGYSRRARDNAFEKRVNPNRTDGQGGNFVPPLWLVDEYIDLPRFGRTTANLARQMPLPTGTDSINLPKVATGTTAAVQSADAGGCPRRT